ncbi:MAG: hypothetical protein GX973_07000 [Firmicutes bacterium]|nr:hypothetical protein [Bacillota bacterium]
MEMQITQAHPRHLETGIVGDGVKKEKMAEQPAKIRVRIRFDYRGTPRPARFFFGGKGTKEVAEERREQQATMWRNVPLQGIRVEDIAFLELYSVYEDEEEGEITYAPLELLISLDSLEDSLQFISRDEFKCLEVIEPDRVNLTGRELERILYRFSVTLQHKLQEREDV